MSRDEFEIVLDGLIQLGIFERDAEGRITMTQDFARDLMAKVDDVLARPSLAQALKRHEIADSEVIILIVAEAVKRRAKTIDVETLAKYVDAILAYFYAAAPERFKAVFG
jgi:hypothetical protein